MFQWHIFNFQLTFDPPGEKANTAVLGGSYGSPVFEGVAKNLGYKSKKGYQKV
jgi:hypothetical protein